MAKKRRRGKAARVRHWNAKVVAAATYAREIGPDTGRGIAEVVREMRERAAKYNIDCEIIK